MPEGPEVKIITNSLNKLVKNTVLADLKIKGGRYEKTTIENYDSFFLLPESERKVISVNCKGKFIWFKFKTWSLWNTLGMSGGWTITDCKHCDIEFITNKTIIWFKDHRHFGTLKFCDSEKLLETKLNSIGYDMLSDDIDKNTFIKVLDKHHTKTLPKCLMNQSIFSGIGNYLKAEVLYASKISPFRKIKNLTYEEKVTLFNNIKSIIMASYRAGGASIRNYSDIYNNDGKFTFEFKVYNQKEDSFGHKVEKVKTDDGRTTHWVEEIQK